MNYDPRPGINRKLEEMQDEIERLREKIVKIAAWCERRDRGEANDYECIAAIEHVLDRDT